MGFGTTPGRVELVQDSGGSRKEDAFNDALGLAPFSQWRGTSRRGRGVSISESSLPKLPTLPLEAGVRRITGNERQHSRVNKIQLVQFSERKDASFDETIFDWLLFDFGVGLSELNGVKNIDSACRDLLDRIDFADRYRYLIQFEVYSYSDSCGEEDTNPSLRQARASARHIYVSNQSPRLASQFLFVKAAKIDL